MFRQILNTLFTKILTGVLNLVIAIIISRGLGAEGKGVQGIILTTISILVIFSGIIGPGGLTYLLPRLHFSLLIVPSYLWSLIITSIMSVFLFHTDLINTKYIIHVLILTFLLSINGVNIAILHVKKRIQASNTVGIVQICTILISLLYSYFISKNLEIESYIFALYFGYSSALIVSYVFTIEYYFNTNYLFPVYKYFVGIKKHLKYGGFNQLDILTQVLSFRLAFYLLKYFTNMADVGIYSNSVSLIESIWIISRSLSLVHHSRIVNSRDSQYNNNLTLLFLKVAGVLASFAILVFILIPSSFYQYVFGAEFGLIRNVILSLSPGVLFFSISFVIGSYLSGVGKHYINSLSSMLGLVVIILMSIILIPLYGIIGAGVAASASYFITTLIKIISFFKIGQIKIKQIIPTYKDFILLKELVVKK